ncbi:hypothetical protein BN871_EY_00370 [Paenibacillus sp. P22]|nr:hypothetical protein BN871_EY_00370 [Paenibacillus sp. P22]
MRPGNRRLMAAGAVVMCTVMAIGCSSQSGDGGKTSSGKTTVTITYRDDGIGEKGVLYKWIKEVASTFPDKSIEIKPTPIQASEGDYFAKIALALKSKDTAPDIVTEDTFILNSDAAAGYLEPLDERLKGWKDWSNGSFIEAMKKGVTASDGKVYGVPYNTDSRGLWYNKDLFKKAGLPEDWKPKTWDEVLDAARAIKAKVPDVVPIWMNMGKATGEATSMQTYEMLLYGTGERLYDDASGKWVTKSQGITDALSFIETVNKEKLGPPLSKVLNGQAGNTASREYLPKGKLAISLDGSWIPGNYLDGGAAPVAGIQGCARLRPDADEQGAGAGLHHAGRRLGALDPEQRQA